MSLVWDPPRDVFVLPVIDHPITWYGLFFALGFIVGYYMVRHFLTLHLHSFEQGVRFSDRLTLLVVIGTILGARLGHVLLYEWSYYAEHPGQILKVWEGGLASHGGAIGIFLALLVFVVWSKKEAPSLTFLTTLDVLAPPATFVAGCIRLGNFVNQEILGTPTTLPWGVTFLHPVQAVGKQPLHPVQLYEALAYFALFSFLLLLWKRLHYRLGEGILIGVLFFFLFGFRFFIEAFKAPQNSFDATSSFHMGQILSLPFVVIGGILLIRAFMKRESK